MIVHARVDQKNKASEWSLPPEVADPPVIAQHGLINFRTKEITAS